jgi:tRNA(Met) C34 N-acetyltransferase TmcA
MQATIVNTTIAGGGGRGFMKFAKEVISEPPVNLTSVEVFNPVRYLDLS